MKVALLTDGISPYVLGGMQRHSFYVAKYLASRGVFVDLYHCNQSALDIGKLEVFSEAEKKYIRSFVLEFPAPGRLPGHYIRESFAYAVSIFEKLKGELEGVDFIYAKGFCAWKLLQEKEKGFRCPPVGIKFHGLEMFQEVAGWSDKIKAWMLRSPVKYNLKQADYHFSYGGKITDLLVDQGLSRKKILEIPSGISSDWVGEALPVHQPRSFLFVGRYERRKGVEELLKAIQLLPGENFVFHFVGPIPVEKQIRDPRIVYHGEVREIQALRSYYDQADILLCPSYSEGMPNTIMEACARGLAVIATNVGATEVLVNDKNGFLLDNNAPGAIAKAMKDILRLKDDELSEHKQQSLLLAKEKLNWEKIADRLVETIQQITAKA